MHAYTKKTLIREIVVVLISLAMLIPFYLLIVVAFKGDAEALTSPATLPKNPTFDSFAAAIDDNGTGGLLTGMLNSLIITGCSLVLLIGIGSLAAYVITRRPGRLSAVMYVLFLVGIILPFQLGIVPAYIVMRQIGLVGTQIGMIALYTALLMPLSVFLYTGFVRSLPKDYEEAAQVDGAKPFQVFRSIVFPLLGPATGTVAIITGLIIWNDFFTALIFTNGSTAATLPVAVYSFVGSLVSRWNVIFAAVLISLIPITIFYLIAQKRFIQGFAGGIKS